MCIFRRRPQSEKGCEVGRLPSGGRILNLTFEHDGLIQFTITNLE